jgi:exonuclease VII large subunit
MPKIVFLMFFFFSLLSAEPATKDDIKELIGVMNKKFEQVDKRLNQVDKRLDKFDMRFEQVDKRFEQMNKNFDKRFEQMNRNFDKRFEQADKRFESIQHNMDKRFDLLVAMMRENNRQIDKRFEDMNTKFYLITSIMIAGFGIVINFLMKERVNIKNDVLEDVKVEIEKKSNKVDKIVAIFEDLATRDEFIRETLERHNLKYSA